MHKAIVYKKNSKKTEEIFFERKFHNDFFHYTIFALGEFGEKEQIIVADERIKSIIYDEKLPNYD